MKKTNIRLVFAWRDFSYLFRRNWYSLYRWHNEVALGGRYWKLIDIGILTIGIKYNKRSK